jgi:hypothetical protein
MQKELEIEDEGEEKEKVKSDKKISTFEEMQELLNRKDKLSKRMKVRTRYK